MEACLNQATVIQCGTETFLKASHEAGFRCVELRSQKLDEYLLHRSHSQLRRLVRDLGMRIATLNGLEFFSLVPEDNYPFMLKRAEYQLVLCHSLEISDLVLVPSMNPDGIVTGAVIDKTVRTVGLVSKMAKKMGVRVDLEIVGNPSFSLRKIDEALIVLERLQDENVFLALDNLCLYEGENETDEVRKIPVEKIAIVHANDARKKSVRDYTLQERLFPGDGDLELKTFYGILKEKEYRGPVSVEIFNEEIWAKDPKEAAQRAWQSIQRFLH